MQTPKQELGMRGEEAAVGLLRKQGCTIVDRNWRQGRLELDIVCIDGEMTVFVEVKTRSLGVMGSPSDAISLQKRKTLGKAARAWLAAHKAWARACRFDVICVMEIGQELALEHYQNAFDLSPASGGGNFTWQPW